MTRDHRTTPVPTPLRQTTPDPVAGSAIATTGAVDTFLSTARATPKPADRARLIFALDATMSRQPTWDLACRVQGEMFAEAAALRGLDVQLAYFRGFSECRASRFVSDARSLTDLMTRIPCQGGLTQIGRILDHIRKEASVSGARAFVFVGDAMEEAIDPVCAKAGELGLLGVRGFFFHEGTDTVAERAFRECARLTGGAYARFDVGAPETLRGLLRAAAAYASGGHSALSRLAAQRSDAKLLITQMR